MSEIMYGRRALVLLEDHCCFSSRSVFPCGVCTQYKCQCTPPLLRADTEFVKSTNVHRARGPRCIHVCAKTGSVFRLLFSRRRMSFSSL
jgi:hypothetical protein